MNINKKIQAMSHSGATLEIEKSDDGFFVSKKIYSSVERNLVALKKQEKFPTMETASYTISPVALTSINIENEVLCVKMPYIEGVGSEQFAVHGNRLSANNLKIALNTYLIRILATSKLEEIDNNIILRKVEDIENRKYSESISYSVTKACKYVRAMCSEKLQVPIGTCHGDLTLSNMIVSVNKLYLFDFLDTFVESPLQDAAKIIQDMKYGWSFRKSRESVKLKGKLYCESAFPDFINTIENLYPREMKLFEILTIIRIAPYISEEDEITKMWLKESLSLCLED